jgi:hypothetical protein
VASVATRPADAGAEPARGGVQTPAERARAGSDALLALAIAAGLVALAFLTEASFDGASLGANTWTQIALVVLAAGSLAAVILLGGRAHAWGLTAAGLFAALAALSYLSIAWSVQPAYSWLEANRTLSYLAAFAAAMALARIAPTRWRALVGAIALWSLALSGWALLVKVFPATLDAGNTFGRLTAPFGYWNAVGLTGAMGLPACLWLGGRREAPRPLRAAVVPAVAILVAALFLTYGRGALAAAAVGLAVWFAFVEFRLRAALVLILGGIGGGVAILWALKHHALSHDNIGLGARDSAGHSFGVVLVLLLIALAAAGYVVAVVSDRRALSAPARRRVGIALIAAGAMVPLLGIAAVASSSRGLTGEISHVWNELTSPSAHLGDTSGRLVQVGSSRPIYWREGLLVGEHALFKGVGAGGFETASLRYAKNRWGLAAHAHSYVIQTFADFGLLGLALSLGLLVAWGLAAASALGVRPRAGPEHATERAALATLLAIVVIFGVHSAIDWTWFVPGVAVPALACAGWLAGRGPLAQPAAKRLAQPAAKRPTASSRARAPGRIAAVIAVAAAALISAWAIWQPLRSANADSAALAAVGRGDTRAAYAAARAAHTYDPVSVDPLYRLALVYTVAGDPVSARAELLSATTLQPANPDAWAQLGSYDLSHHRPRAGHDELEQALRLDPGSPALQAEVASAPPAP